MKKHSRLAINAMLIGICIISITYYAAYGMLNDKNKKYSTNSSQYYKTFYSASVEEQNIINLKSYAKYVLATAYTSDPSETDSTPYITASGSLVHYGTIAANFLPIGTKIIIPKLFGNKIFVVEDRMNPRYNNKKIIDIWFPSKSIAKSFGKKHLEIFIIK